MSLLDNPVVRAARQRAREILNSKCPIQQRLKLLNDFYAADVSPPIGSFQVTPVKLALIEELIAFLEELVAKRKEEKDAGSI